MGGCFSVGAGLICIFEIFKRLAQFHDGNNNSHCCLNTEFVLVVCFLHFCLANSTKECSVPLCFSCAISENNYDMILVPAQVL